MQFSKPPAMPVVSDLEVHKALAAEQITIPYPQQDVHLVPQPQQK